MGESSRGIAREEERICGKWSTVTGHDRTFGIKASRVIDWCSSGYTQRHVLTEASTDVVVVCAWELLKAEWIRQEKAAAVKKGTERALPSFLLSGCHGQFSLSLVLFLSNGCLSKRDGKIQTFLLKARTLPYADRYDDAFVWNRIIETLPLRKCVLDVFIRTVFWYQTLQSIFIIRHYKYIDIVKDIICN